jgi:thymidylate synthase (FAD)
MIVATPYAKLITPAQSIYGNLMLQSIVQAARISHRSEDSHTSDSVERFAKAVIIEHGDWSVVEHQSAQVEFLVDRGITHEIVRHRLFSFTQESTRFVNYEKKMPPQFIYPGVNTNCAAYRAWESAMEYAELSYKTLLSIGWRPQEARSVLPNALAAKLLMSGNLRSWRWFLLMRTTKETHPQLRQVTIPLLEEFKRRIPILFDDIEPMERQAVNTKKAH